MTSAAGNFVQATGVVVPPQLPKRVLIKPVQDVTQFLMIAGPRCEALTIGLAKRAYKRVAMLSADLSMLVTMALIQSGLFHGNPLCVYGPIRKTKLSCPKRFAEKLTLNELFAIKERYEKFIIFCW
jgi:hypothetical protein